MRRKRKIPSAEQVSLSPWAKLSRYGRIPYKFICTVVLITLTTWLNVILTSNFSAYYRATDTTWRSLFAPKDPDSSAWTRLVTDNQESSLSTFDQFFSTVDNVLSNYYNIDDVALGHYKQAKNKTTGAALPVQLKVSRYAVKSADGFFAEDGQANPPVVQDQSQILPHVSAKQALASLGTEVFGDPFKLSRDTATKLYVRSILRLELFFGLQNFDMDHFSGRHQCWMWHINIMLV